MKIILISGKARHGKDTSAEMLKKNLELINKNVLIMHYADALKFIAKQYFSWDGKKDNIGRNLLQWLGTDKVRKINPDFWVNFITEFIKIFKEDFDYFIISDCRFENEIEQMKKNFENVIALRIVRSEYISELSIEQQNHLSETALDNYSFDYVLYNHEGLENLEREIDIFIFSMLNKELENAKSI